ncbi:MAG: sigma 54-interacting transcriptional regulator [Desulfobacterales bacterium]|nr:sigma 54-interacting transcriptional regulator [Desulfobacterales bacterium]
MSSLHEIPGLLDKPVALEKILDEIPSGIVILDKNLRIRYMNRAISALTGYSPDEARTISCHNILRSRVCIKSCPAAQMTENTEPICKQSDLINRDRQKIPVRITLAPLREESGSLIGYMETVEDIRSIQQRGTEMQRAFGYSKMIGKSQGMDKVFRMLPLIAQNESSVLVTGETGTGKDLAAEAIHESSGRAKGPFIKINCGALPETLLESELFGHQKGAFTGAVENKPGRFRLAHNGTLYLTEIGDLPLSLQVKLLTFLDDKIVYPLGSTRGHEVNVRIIAGTHRDLEDMVRQGNFRKDLLFRLNVVRVHLPPLRERGDDIRLLMDHFLNIFTTEFGKKIKGFENDAVMLLKNYSYPGNVRELRNITEYAVNVCQAELIGLSDLPAYLVETGEQAGSQTLEPAPARSRAPGLQHSSSSISETWPETEKKMIIDALVRTGGRRSKAAAILGWARSTLWRKIKQYNIE